ncbi:MAG: hypothetical protein ABJC90_05085 [Roseobacter sp.]
MHLKLSKQKLWKFLDRTARNFNGALCYDPSKYKKWIGYTILMLHAQLCQ